MTGITNMIKSQIRDQHERLISSLVISNTEIPGEYLFSATDTSDWPTDQSLYLDIQYSENGVTISSETIRLAVSKDVTR